MSCKSASRESAHERAAEGLRTVELDVGALDRLGVKIDPAGTGTGGRTLSAPGTLDYNYDHYGEVGSPLEGRVASIRVRLGDRVKKGQALATVVVPSVANAQADALVARASTVAAEQNRQREEDLLQRQLTTAREAELARSEAIKAEADRAAAESRLRALNVAVPESKATILSAGMVTLTAPIDGIVVVRKANVGVFLHPSDTAFVVADLNELWASLDIYESDVTYLKPGAEVDLTIDALQGRVIKGKVELLEPQLGKVTRTARARIVVPNADGSLKPGLFVRALIRLPNSESGKLLVPAESVQPLGDADVVFVEIRPGVFEVRRVEVARRSGEIAEIARGLSPAERIVVRGAFLLRGEVTKQ